METEEKGSMIGWPVMDVSYGRELQTMGLLSSVMNTQMKGILGDGVAVLTNVEVQRIAQWFADKYGSKAVQS